MGSRRSRQAGSAARWTKCPPPQLPVSNVFCYGQVESPYGSGQFIKDLNEHFDVDDSLVVSEIKGKDAIMESIRDFLGKGK